MTAMLLGGEVEGNPLEGRVVYGVGAENNLEIAHSGIAHIESSKTHALCDA